MVFIVELRLRGALQWLILLKPRPRYANRHMQMREDVYWFDWYFIKYSAAFFSCNGGIFLFDLSTFTDNISRHRVFVKTTFLFPWTFDRFFIIFFFSFSLFFCHFWFRLHFDGLFFANCRRCLLHWAHTWRWHETCSIGVPVCTRRNNGRFKPQMCCITNQSVAAVQINGGRWIVSRFAGR